MAAVVLQGVAKRFGQVSVIEGLDLEIKDGEFMVLVGPSGCGKSTALRMVAGLEEITGGTISIGGRVVNDVPPKDRDIAMVFQSYALYPHMTVRENLEFGLKIRKTPAGRDGPARRRGGPDPRHRSAPRAQAEGALRRPAAAGGAGPGHRPQALGLPLRRAALQPRRQAARPDARRDQEAAGPPRRHRDLRDPRPDRGHDHGPPHRGAPRRQAPAGAARRWRSTSGRPTSSWPPSSARRP